MVEKASKAKVLQTAVKPGEVKKKKTISDIAREQGVKPFNAEEIGKNWPEGADYDEWIGAIHEARKHDS